MIIATDPTARPAATAAREDGCPGMNTTGSDNSPIPPVDKART